MLDQSTEMPTVADARKFDVAGTLTRAFTKRNKRPVITPPTSAPTRAASTRTGPINRHQISSPVELLSTTNVLAYDAPDIPGLSSTTKIVHSSSASSMDSGNDSDSSPAHSSASSVTTLDNSFGECSPSPVEPNHLSLYFQTPGRSSTSSRQSSASSDADAPPIPSRAMSHTRRSHQAIARKRSQARMSPPPNIISTSPSVDSSRTSVDMFTNKVEANHPFGAELEQVNELAEDFAAREVIVMDEEEQFLMSHGLRKFGAEDYVMEIEGLFQAVFEDSFIRMDAGWI